MNRLTYASLATLLMCAPACGDDGTGSESGDNQAPSADPGQDLAVTVGDQVLLSGSGSTDPEEASLSYTWRFVSLPGGSSATLLNPESEGPTFVTDRAGTYTLELVVNDGELDSAPAQVIVTATLGSSNVRPIANAGPDRDAVTNQTVVQLDATSSSDPEGSALNYLWARKSFPAGSSAALNTNDPANPTFVPDRDGDYVFRLQVNDGVTVSEIDEVTVRADSQSGIAISAGNAQTGTVDTAAPQPLSVQVTNAFGLPVRFVSVQFNVTDGNGAVSTTFTSTNAEGIASTTLTFGTIAGINGVTATCSSCATTQNVDFTATGTHDTPVGVELEPVADVLVGQSMTLLVSLVDQFGNIATENSTAQFTINAAGAGAVQIDSASVGSLVSGAGTTTALVGVSSGQASLSVTNDTAELVTFTMVDSQALGLSDLGQVFDEIASPQGTNCNGGVNSFSFDVSGVGAPRGDATVEVTGVGDLNASFETFAVFLENTGGTSYGEVFDSSSAYCTAITDSTSIPLVDIGSYMADGVVGIDVVSDSSVSCSCGSDTVQVRLTVDAEAQGEFL